MADDAMFAPLTPGERPAALAKRKMHDWIPIPVPDGVPLPAVKPWLAHGIGFPMHSLGRPTSCHWFAQRSGAGDFAANAVLSSIRRRTQMVRRTQVALTRA